MRNQTKTLKTRIARLEVRRPNTNKMMNWNPGEWGVDGAGIDWQAMLSDAGEPPPDTIELRLREEELLAEAYKLRKQLEEVTT